MVIGGLIKEGDSDTISKIPYLGDWRYVGPLFQHRTISRQRTEIIIALLPRLILDEPGARQQHCVEPARAMTPLLQPNLELV